MADAELRVTAHRRAAERRAAGKPVWDRRIDVRSVVLADQGDTSEETAARKANQIGKLLRAKLPSGVLDPASAGYDADLDEAVCDLEGMGAGDYAGMDGYSALQALNDRLETVYDWGDANSVRMSP